MEIAQKKCSCELDWRKEKALYIQNIELLGMEIKELKEKEKNYKGFND
jgi:FtsZ-binding cell division protein ZapB